MNFLATLHLVLMMLAFPVFLVSLLWGFVFLLQENQIKQQRPLPPWLRWAPALEVTDNLHYKILTLGFFLLSLGILTGAFLSEKVFGSYFTKDLRQIVSLVAWGIYALFLNVRIRAGWRGRRGIFLSVIGFVALLLIFFGIQHRGAL